METIYFPILWAKNGELDAISELHDEAKDAIIPVFQLPLPPQKKGGPLRQVDDKYLFEKAKKIKHALGGRPFILDTTRVNLNSGQEKTLIGRLANGELFSNENLIPMLSLGSNSSLFQACYKIGYQPSRVCLKLKEFHLTQPNILSLLRQVIDSLSIDEENIILIVDLEDVSEKNVEALAIHLFNFLSDVIGFFSFGSMVVGAGSFPPSLAGMVPWQYKTLPRRDWRLFTMIASRIESIKYADYGINAVEAAKGFAFKGPPSIRYTTEHDYLIVKGVQPDPLGKSLNEQHRQLSRLIKEHEDYKGLTYGWGDKHIHRCTQPLQPTTGSHTTWRAVGTNHHILLVLESLSKLYGPSVSI